MNYPKITIVTPSYNQGQYLEQTITSILNQNYPNLEYMVIDGGSTDNSLEIIKKYEKHFTHWVSEKDAGQPDAISKGLQKATGAIFNWINSDDYLEPGSLHDISNSFTETKADIVAGNYRLFSDDGALDEECVGTRVNDSYLKTLAFEGIHQPVTFWRTEIIRSLGGINPILHYCMDWEIWLKYLLKYKTDKFAFIDKTIAHIRIHPEAKTALNTGGFFYNNKSKFVIEKNSILHSIARQRGLEKIAEVFNLLSELIQNYQFKIDIEEVEERIIQGFMSYHLLRHAEVRYEKGEIELSNKILIAIIQSTLDKESKEKYAKLVVKSTFPKAVKLIRKISRRDSSSDEH